MCITVRGQYRHVVMLDDSQNLRSVECGQFKLGQLIHFYTPRKALGIITGFWRDKLQIWSNNIIYYVDKKDIEEQVS